MTRRWGRCSQPASGPALQDEWPPSLSHPTPGRVQMCTGLTAIISTWQGLLNNQQWEDKPPCLYPGRGVLRQLRTDTRFRGGGLRNDGWSWSPCPQFVTAHLPLCMLWLNKSKTPRSFSALVTESAQSHKKPCTKGAVSMQGAIEHGLAWSTPAL